MGQRQRARLTTVVPQWFYAVVKNGATRRNITLDLRLEDLEVLYERQGRICALSGKELKFAEDSRRRNDSTASLDRIDSSKGYVEGNVQWVHKVVNLMKNTLSQEEFKDWCRVVAGWS